MVTKVKNAPSYLISRNGIFYFQLRIPDYIQLDKINKSRVFRKSTRTGNYREAVRLSHQWWNSIMNDGQYPDLAKAESEDHEHQAMIDRGRDILDQFKISGIDENDPIEFDRFFEFYSTKDQECFHLAKKYLEKDKLEPEGGVQPPIIEPTQPSAPPPHFPVSTIPPSNKRLSDVLDEWVNLRSNIQEGKKKWGKSSMKKYPPQIRIMIDMVGDPYAHEFTDIMLRDLYIPKILMLPERLNILNVYKETINGEKVRKAIDDCFEIAEEFDLSRVAKTTIEDYVVNTCTFLQWAAKKKYIPYGTDVVLDDLKDIAEEDERRKYFTEAELKSLFETEEYQQGLLFNKPFRFFVPLISLYTGCRLGEASQLFVENIHQSDEKWSNGTKAWVFNFTNAGERQTIKGKRKQSRLVPVHKDLVKLGLIKYWEQQKAKGEKQLFSGLSPDSSDHWGRHVSRWFNGEWSNGKRVVGYKEKYNVVTDEERYITFHSFRHYVTNRSKQERHWDYDIWCEITHHSTGTGKTERQKTYENDFNLDLKVEEMEKMTMDFIAINKIKKWE